MKLDKSFFENKDTITLAKDLLWKVITKVTPEGIISGIINETEAYIETDEASHSFLWKKTLRNEVMFKESWHLYVYFTYWMYHCLNIVSEIAGYGSAVLIRSVIPYAWTDIMIKNRNWQNKNLHDLVNWPAKLCLAFWVTKKDNWINILESSSTIFLEDILYKVPEIKISKRIWISKGTDKDWRFWF